MYIYRIILSNCKCNSWPNKLNDCFNCAVDNAFYSLNHRRRRKKQRTKFKSSGINSRGISSPTTVLSAKELFWFAKKVIHLHWGYIWLKNSGSFRFLSQSKAKKPQSTMARQNSHTLANKCLSYRRRWIGNAISSMWIYCLSINVGGPRDGLEPDRSPNALLRKSAFFVPNTNEIIRAKRDENAIAFYRCM